MILVSTTGKGGLEASRLLAQRGLPVRVLAPHSGKAAAPAEAGVEVVEDRSRQRLRLHPVRTRERRIGRPVPSDCPTQTRARVLSKVLGRQISFRPNPCEEQKWAMINAVLPEVVAEDNAKALSLFADGDADYVTDDMPKLLGWQARRFEQLVTDYAAAFS